MSYHFISYHIISYHIISYHYCIVSYHIISFISYHHIPFGSDWCVLHFSCSLHSGLGFQVTLILCPRRPFMLLSRVILFWAPFFLTPHPVPARRHEQVVPTPSPSTYRAARGSGRGSKRHGEVVTKQAVKKTSWRVKKTGYLCYPFFLWLKSML